MAILDAILKKTLQGKLSSLGFDWATVDAVNFSREDRLVHMTLVLDGEELPVTAAVNYRVDGEELLVESVETNKRWMTEVVLMMVERKGGKIELPEGVRGIVLKAIS